MLRTARLLSEKQSKMSVKLFRTINCRSQWILIFQKNNEFAKITEPIIGATVNG